MGVVSFLTWCNCMHITYRCDLNSSIKDKSNSCTLTPSQKKLLTSSSLFLSAWLFGTTINTFDI